MMDVTCLTLILKSLANLIYKADGNGMINILKSLNEFNKIMPVFKMDNKAKNIFIQVCLNLSIKGMQLNTREPFEYLIMNEAKLDIEFDQKYTVN